MPFKRLPNPFRTKVKDVTALPERAATSRTGNQTLPWGLIILAEDADPVVDIVAIHGLDGHREKSWTVNNVNWLRDLLPTDILNARIMSWGYDARTHSFSQIGGKYIYDHGRALVSDLCVKRALTKTSKRPIIFVAHSLGGIVLKSALIHAELAREGALEEHRSIKLSTYGILFMGSPHQGAAGVQLGELVLRIASIIMATDSRAVRNIERDSEWLQQQLQQYAPISQDFVTKFAYEMFPTTSIALGKKIMIVPQISAVVPGTAGGEPIAIPADHVNMVKFASRRDVGYEKVCGHLQVMVEKAVDIIRARWVEQEEFKKTNVTGDFSVPFSLYGIPEVGEFIGRKEELGMMKEALHPDGLERSVVVLQGLGGIGKTQLAVKYLKDHRDSYSAVFWLNGRTEDTLKQSFSVIAKRLHREHGYLTLLETAAEAEDIDRVVSIIRQWLSMKENHRWMLVFDNIDNPRVSGNTDPQAYDIRRYFPEAHRGSIIITTRSSSLKIGRVVQVRKLQDTQESIAILTSMSGRSNLDQDPHAEQIVKKLDGLPLALATAGAYLSQVSTSVEEYIGYYTDQWLELQKTSPELLSYEDRTLYTTWNLSFERIQCQNESAAQLLQLWAYFDSQDVWYQLLAAGKTQSSVWFFDIVKDELSFNKVIRVLYDHGLVEPFEVDGRLTGGYGMHSCVHAWTKHVLNEERSVEMGRIALSCVGSSTAAEEDLEYWIVQRRLLPHAQRCLEVVQNDVDILAEAKESCYDHVHNLGLLFQGQGKLKEAEAMHQRALVGMEKAFGPDHPSTLKTLHGLGSVYMDLGKLKEAENLYQRVLEGYEKALGPDHILTLDTVHNLGNLYQVQGKLKEAEITYQRALEGCEKALGPDHTSTLRTVDNLGILYKNQGKIKEAELIHQRVLEGYEKAFGPDHMLTLHTVHNLGNLYLVQGKLKEAEVTFQRALEGCEKALGPDHTSTLGTGHNLGIVYKKQGKLKEAEILYQRSLEGCEKALGPDHMLTLDTVHNLGNLYLVQGKLKEAEITYRRAIERCEKALGPDHTSTLLTVNNLGTVYQDQGKLKEAENLYQRALAGYEKAVGPDHTLTLATVNNLGTLYRDQGNLKEAQIMYERALEGYEKALGPDHTSTLSAVNNLGALYKEQNNLKEAENLYQRALAGHEKAVGPDHTSTLRTVNNLGILYKNQGKLKEAENMYQRVLEGYEKALGPVHTLTLRTVYNLGNLNRDQGKLKEAEAMLERALEGFEKALGPDHTSTLDTVHNLGILYEDLGKLGQAEIMYQRAVEGTEKALGPHHMSALQTLGNLGNLNKKQGKLKEAEAIYQRALDGKENALGPDHTSTLNTVNNLGLLYMNQDKLKQAETMFQRALEGYEKALGPDHTSTLDAFHILGLLYKNQGKLKEAEIMIQHALAGYEKVLEPDHKSTLDIVYNLSVLYKEQHKYEQAEALMRRVCGGYKKVLGPGHPETLDAIQQLEYLQN